MRSRARMSGGVAMKVDRFLLAGVADRDAGGAARSARLLYVGAGLEDRLGADLPGLLRPGDLLVVVNDTRVIPARLDGRRGAARIGFTLHKAEAADRWRAFARPAKRLRPGDRVELGEGFAATVAGKGEGGEVTLAFDCGGAELMAALARQRAMPPTSSALATMRRGLDYQIAFAARDGRWRRPPPGCISRRGCWPGRRRHRPGGAGDAVRRGRHLPAGRGRGYGGSRDARGMGRGADAAAAIAAARRAGGRIVAVGTTSLRAGAQRRARAARWRRSPERRRWKRHHAGLPVQAAVDLLLTNFHLPRSTCSCWSRRSPGWRGDARRLRARQGGGLPLLFLWRCACSAGAGGRRPLSLPRERERVGVRVVPRRCPHPPVAARRAPPSPTSWARESS
ncbi:MAG: S-adenosylmethionine:tRNA ribosyltransferase-isomerase [Dongiaceae bacterium]